MMQLIVFSFNYNDVLIKSFGKTPDPVVVIGGGYA